MSLRRLIAPLFALVVCVAAGQAAAAPWLRIETDRFIVHGDVSERAIRDYTAKLVAFDAVLRANYPSAAARRPPQKLDVYLVDRRTDLRVINPSLSPNVAGFYATVAIEPFFVADISTDNSRDPGRLADVVLFHEYAHHFMRAYLPGAIPAWLNEGWAEYFGATVIDDDKVTVGGVARGGSLFSVWLPMEDVFSKTVFELPRDQVDRFYAQAWIFVHYMQATPERTRQLGQILESIGKGQSSVAAITSVTGMDIAALTRELKAYRRITAMTFPNPTKTAPALTVTRESDASDDLQLDWLRSVLGCGGDQAFIAGVRAKAARHPDDPYAQRILAHAEFRCGDPKAGEATIDRILAQRPDDVATLRVGAVDLAYSAANDRARTRDMLQKARALAAHGYALDPNNGAAIFAYVMARRVQPGFPTPNDVTSIRTALALLPSVPHVALLAGEVLMRSGQRGEGRALLLEVANNPHGGPMAAFARRLLARNDSDVSEALAKPVGETEEPAN